MNINPILIRNVIIAACSGLLVGMAGKSIYNSRAEAKKADEEIKTRKEDIVVTEKELKDVEERIKKATEEFKARQAEINAHRAKRHPAPEATAAAEAETQA